MKLKNKSRRMQIISLPHDEVCSADECICEMVTFQQVEHDGKTGETGIRHTDRLICKAVHIAPGEVSEELPETAEIVSAVVSGVRSRALEIC